MWSYFYVTHCFALKTTVSRAELAFTPGKQKYQQAVQNEKARCKEWEDFTMRSQVRVAQQQFALQHILFTFFPLWLPFWANQNNWRAVWFDQCSPSQLPADIAVNLVLFRVVSIHWKWRQATCVLFLSKFSVCSVSIVATVNRAELDFAPGEQQYQKAAEQNNRQSKMRRVEVTYDTCERQRQIARENSCTTSATLTFV